MNYLTVNLKHLRKTHPERPTQATMAGLLGVRISTYGAYEEGRAEPNLANIRKITQFFGVTAEDLIGRDLRNGMPAEGEKTAAAPAEGHGQPQLLCITVDREGRDNVEWVPVKAAAGYTRGLGDPEYVRELPSFQVPFLDNRRKYRAFTIEGDSMLPIPSGALIFAEYTDNWEALRDGTACIVVTRSEGIVFKKVYNYLKTQGCLLLVSSNPLYAPYLTPVSEILEIWKFAGFFSDSFPDGEVRKA